MYVHDVSHFSLTMKLKICRDDIIDDIFCNETNTNCIPLPDNFLWSEEAKLRFQEAFHTPEIKNKISDIEKELDSNSVLVQSLIDQITDVMLLAGNKSLLRRSFKLKRKPISKTNKKWYVRTAKFIKGGKIRLQKFIKEVKSAKENKCI